MNQHRQPELRRDGHGPAISLIKWTGSKRLQAAKIVARFPAGIATYHEPFLGGGSVLGRLLDSDIRVGRYECSDSYAPLIALWHLVRDDPERLIDGYARLWVAAKAGDEQHYLEVRRSFNQDRSPVEFFFLLRTCRLGHVRINANGDFTSAFDRSRAGTDPELLRPVAQSWHRKLVAADVRFAVRDYREVASEPGDLLYLDPPYRTSTLYYGRMDYGEMFGWLGPQRGDYLLSLNGHVGGVDQTLVVPGDLYDEHLQVEAGDNRLHRLTVTDRPLITDSLYIRRGEKWVSRSAPLTAAEREFGEGDDVRRDASISSGRLKARPHSEGMSAAIRSLLDFDPKIKPVEVKRRLAGLGLTVSSPLFRVVRRNWRRANEEAELSLEREMLRTISEDSGPEIRPGSAKQL